MKLAEALQERADLNIRIQQLKCRMENSAIVQEGESPSENPSALQSELDDSLSRLTWLIGRINLTNCSISVNGMTLTEMIAQKDALSLKLSIYRNLVSTAGHCAYRARQTEIKVLPTIPVAELQKKVDSMAKELRLLDNQLQQTNWTTDLIEKS